MANPQTPLQEAISLITIVAILVGAGAYVAAPPQERAFFVAGAVLGGGVGLLYICFRH